MEAAFKQLNISDLLLDKDNLRITDPNVQTEKEIVNWIVNDDTSGTKELMKDLLEKGLSPFVNISAIADSSNKGKYIVKEGNRRVACFKMLETPTLVVDKNFQKHINSLLKKFSAVTSLPVIVMDASKDEVDYFLALHHNGEQNGKGLKQWDPGRKSKLAKAVTGKSNYPEAEHLLEQLDFPDPHSFKNISTLQRFVGNTPLANLLGYTKKNGQISGLSQQALYVLSAIADLVQNNKLKHNAGAYDTDKILELANDIISNAPKSGANTAASNSSATNTAKAATKGKCQPTTVERKNLIPKTCKIAISHTRLNDIFGELKKIKIDEHPNAVSVLFRVFLEISTYEFIKTNSKSFTTLWTNMQNTNFYHRPKLKDRVQEVIKYFEGQGQDKNKFKGITTELAKKHSFADGDTFNYFTHSGYAFPSPQELKVVWNIYQPLIELLF